MHFCWVTLPVTSFEKSLAFYHELLGLPIHSRHGGNGTEIAMLGAEDQPKIELLYNPQAKQGALHSDITVGIAVDSLDKAMDYLNKNGVPTTRGPICPNPHIRFAFVLDPNGYEVQLVESK